MIVDEINMDKVFQSGEILEDSGDYETYYSDSPGGEYIQLKIIKYKDKLYVHKEKIVEDHELNQKRECVGSYELK